MSTAPPTTVDGQLAELIHPFTTHVLVGTEPYRFHTVSHDSLVDQLNTVVTLTTSTAGEVFHASYGSKPAGRLDALSLLQDIDTQSGQMLYELGFPHSATAPLKERLGHLRTELHLRRVEQEATVRSWWARARVYAQLDGPTYSPNVLCPTAGCFERGTLHVRLTERVATCSACASVWTPETDPRYDELAAWAAWSSEHLVAGHRCDECHVTAQLVTSTRAEKRNH